MCKRVRYVCEGVHMYNYVVMTSVLINDWGEPERAPH